MAEPTPQTTLVVILGASEFPRANLSASASFANSAEAIEAYFVSPEGFGLPKTNVLSGFNSAKTSPDLNDEIGTFLERRITELHAAGTPATDVVVYYVGHGGFGEQDAYFLALYDTRQGNELQSSLPITVLANTLRQHARNPRRYLILDACFSAVAYRTFQSGPMEVVWQKTSAAFPERGTALLCASGARDPAKAPPDKPYTMFSGALRDVLVSGDADEGSKLSLVDLGRVLERVIVERYQDEAVRPEVHSPSQRDGDVGVLPLFPNPASQGAVVPVALRAMLEDTTNPMIREGAYRILGAWLIRNDASRARFARERLEQFRHAEELAAPRDAIDEIVHAADRVGTAEREEQALRQQLGTAERATQALRKRLQRWGAVLGGVALLLLVVVGLLFTREPMSDAELTEQITRLEQKVQGLQKAAAQVEAEKKRAETKLAEQNTELGALKRQLGTGKTRIAQLETQEARHAKQVGDLRAQIATLEKDKAKLLAARPAPPPKSPQPTVVEHGIEFVLIPAGEFQMGSPASEKERDTDEQQHRVRISKAFYLGKYEVTQAQWETVMGQGSHQSRFTGAQLPVENVSWEDVQAFLRKLNRGKTGATYRLPTEAEWEYAARAGTTTVFHYGNRLSSTQANFDGNYPYGGAGKGPYVEKTTPVGSYKPNAWGLYDMHGNVWEWVQDWYGKDYYASSPALDPQGPTSGEERVLRGGSWHDFGRVVRSAYRGAYAPGSRDDYIGFRLARGQETGK